MYERRLMKEGFEDSVEALMKNLNSQCGVTFKVKKD